MLSSRSVLFCCRGRMKQHTSCVTSPRDKLVTGVTSWQVRPRDWSRLITWPEYLAPIGQYRSRDLNTGFWLYHQVWHLAMAAYRHRRDSVLEQVSDINSLHKLLLCAKWETEKILLEAARNMCFMLFDLRYGTMNSLERYFRWHGRLVARQVEKSWWIFLFLGPLGPLAVALSVCLSVCNTHRLRYTETLN